MLEQLLNYIFYSEYCIIEFLCIHCCRRFSTVEACCKSMSGDAYVDIPVDESFVQALRTEVGLLDAGKIATVNVKKY